MSLIFSYKSVVLSAHFHLSLNFSISTNSIDDSLINVKILENFMCKSVISFIFYAHRLHNDIRKNHRIVHHLYCPYVCVKCLHVLTWTYEKNNSNVIAFAFAYTHIQVHLYTPHVSTSILQKICKDISLFKFIKKKIKINTFFREHIYNRNLGFNIFFAFIFVIYLIRRFCWCTQCEHYTLAIVTNTKHTDRTPNHTSTHTWHHGNICSNFINFVLFFSFTIKTSQFIYCFKNRHKCLPFAVVLNGVQCSFN